MESKQDGADNAVISSSVSELNTTESVSAQNVEKPSFLSRFKAFFKRFGRKLTVKEIAYCAVLVALSVIANIFSIPVAGYSIMISLAYLPIVLAGAFMGPFAGFIVGILGDGLAYLIHPLGAWIPLITLSNGIMGLIPGLIFKYLKINPYINLAISMVLIFVICTCGITTVGLFLVYAKGKKTFFVYLFGRLATQSIVFAANLAIIYGLYPILKKAVFGRIRV